MQDRQYKNKTQPSQNLDKYFHGSFFKMTGTKIANNSLKVALLLFAVFMIFMSLIPQTEVYAAKKKYKNWTGIAEDMEKVLLESKEAYSKEDYRKAYDKINEAYFGYYEVHGFEKTVMSYISGKRGREVEGRFADLKRWCSKAEQSNEYYDHLDALIKMLYEDAATLDGTSSSDSGKQESQQNASSSLDFVSSFTITLREGLEAILVIAAILAYLDKTKNKSFIKYVTFGAFMGIVFSIILAIIFNIITNTAKNAMSAGLGQEIFEGVAMFLAVIVLFWVSNWMLSKSEVEEWNRYIKTQVETAVTKNSGMALIFSAFIAVAREGAELILFMQALFANESNKPKYLWLGVAAATICLAIVFFIIRKLTVRLPLKPFFYFTSILMYLMCISFTGKGVAEFQEANLISRSPIPGADGLPVLEPYGIFWNYENLIPQFILIAITVVMIIVHVKKTKRISAQLAAGGGEEVLRNEKIISHNEAISEAGSKADTEAKVEDKSKLEAKVAKETEAEKETATSAEANSSDGSEN